MLPHLQSGETKTKSNYPFYDPECYLNFCENRIPIPRNQFWLSNTLIKVSRSDVCDKDSLPYAIQNNRNVIKLAIISNFKLSKVSNTFSIMLLHLQSGETKTNSNYPSYDPELFKLL